MLNTISQIKSMCKEFNVEVIASTDLIEELEMIKNFKIEALGAIKLRGKEKGVLLNTIKSFVPA